MIKPHGSDTLNPLFVRDDDLREELIKEAEGLPSIVVCSAAAANAVIGLFEELLAEDPYKLDGTFNPNGWVLFYEGMKGEQANEWCGTSYECYMKFDVEAERRALSFVRRNAEAGKPFYMAWWPQWASFVPQPKKTSLQRGMVGDAYETGMDAAVGTLMETLRELGIAENTLIIAMSDNGPMTHNPPPGAGMGEGIFRGGKGDFLEGGVRVSAQAWWPGVIEPGTKNNDIISHEDWMPTLLAAVGEPDIIEKLKQGHTANGKQWKVHLDGYNFLPRFKGEAEEGPRNQIFYFGQGGELNAVRWNDWKIHFAILEGNITDAQRIEPSWPLVINLKADPYEHAWEESGMYLRWMADNMWLFVPVAGQIQNFVASLDGYPFQEGQVLNPGGLNYRSLKAMKVLEEMKTKGLIERPGN